MLDRRFSQDSARWVAEVVVGCIRVRYLAVISASILTRTSLAIAQLLWCHSVIHSIKLRQRT